MALSPPAFKDLSKNATDLLTADFVSKDNAIAKLETVSIAPFGSVVTSITRFENSVTGQIKSVVNVNDSKVEITADLRNEITSSFSYRQKLLANLQGTFDVKSNVTDLNKLTLTPGFSYLHQYFNTSLKINYQPYAGVQNGTANLVVGSVAHGIAAGGSAEFSLAGQVSKLLAAGSYYWSGRVASLFFRRESGLVTFGANAYVPYNARTNLAVEALNSDLNGVNVTVAAETKTDPTSLVKARASTNGLIGFVYRQRLANSTVDVAVDYNYNTARPVAACRISCY